MELLKNFEKLSINCEKESLKKLLFESMLGFEGISGIRERYTELLNYTCINENLKLQIIKTIGITDVINFLSESSRIDMELFKLLN